MTRTGWLDVTEAGAVFGIRFVVFVCTVFGRAPARAVVRPVALYYALVHGTARRASRAWLEKIHGRHRVTFGMIYAHLLRFAQVALDRCFLVRRQMGHFEIGYHGEEHLRTLRAAKKGAILLGAHLGSFEVLRVIADMDRVGINVLGYFHNAKRINAALERLDPGTRTRLIEIDRGGFGFIFAVQECVERGEHVALLGDRVGLGGPTVEVKFMGAGARLPIGAYLLAAALKCPVYLIFGLYSEPNRYDIHCELFAEEVVLTPNAKSEQLVEYAQRYADRLAHYGRLAPDNWFNFFDFWGSERD